MVMTTPFHERLSQLNTEGLYGHWSGHLSALRYSHAPKHEYFAVRNSVGVFDTSPLFKYWIRGRDAERLLAGVMARDIRQCKPGNAQYTIWCDERGFVLEDGVVFRHSGNEFMLTAARPNLGYLSDLVGRLEVELEDVSADYGMLAVQGPRSREVIGALTDDVNALKFFGLVDTKIGSAPVTLSRTGYTGDLGFEIRVPSEAALDVLDAVLDAGAGHGIRPFGEDALMMLRIEAGLALIDVDFHSSRFAYTDHDRVTPKELGMSWMLRGLDTDDRPFIGRRAIERELAEGTSRWATVGLWIDWQDWDRLHRDGGLLPPKDENPVPWESAVYDEQHVNCGYATSLMYSPVLQRHIGMARVRPDQAKKGTRVNVELTLNHETVTVAAETGRLPFFNPERKTA
jgi:aminomethyltransferase